MKSYKRHFTPCSTILAVLFIFCLIFSYKIYDITHYDCNKEITTNLKKGYTYKHASGFHVIVDNDINLYNFIVPPPPAFGADNSGGTKPHKCYVKSNEPLHLSFKYYENVIATRGYNLSLLVDNESNSEYVDIEKIMKEEFRNYSIKEIDGKIVFKLNYKKISLEPLVLVPLEYSSEDQGKTWK